METRSSLGVGSDLGDCSGLCDSVCLIVWVLVVQVQRNSHRSAPQMCYSLEPECDCMPTLPVVWPLTLLLRDPKCRLPLMVLVAQCIVR